MAKKDTSKRKPYTQEELKLIREAPMRNLKDLAFSMKRSYASVRRKKWQMDNMEKDRERKREHRRRMHSQTDANAKNKNTVWSKWEENYIMTSKESDMVIAEKLQRTVGAVQIKRNRLKKEKNEAKRRKQKRAEKIRRDYEQSPIL